MVKLLEYEANYMDIQYTNSPWSPTMMEPLAELGDGGFEPQTRARSNTWPLPRPENYVDPPDDTSNKCIIDGITSVCDASGLVQPPGGGLGNLNSGVCGNGGYLNNNLGGPLAGPGGMGGAVLTGSAKKNSSRRNAWGNLSYADLITQAITSAPDKRLTLSQIYEWMVTNVPYFKDKGDSNSSAGWKNSIRHNLSLHNRFMRVQNEGTGKSSWWMINPDAKPGKSVRRRAASMETSKFEKRRGRVKKKVEALRNGLAPDATPSPSSSVEGLDMFPESPLHSGTGFQLSPDFRPRASSATSSCGGRLSPIPAILGVEPDWSAPSPYPSSGGFGSTDTMISSGGTNNGSYSPDQLAGNLEQGMKLQTDYLQGYLNGQQPTPTVSGAIPPPPAYSQQPYDTTAAPFSQHNSSQNNSSQPPPSYGGTTGGAAGAGVLSSQCPLHRLQPCNCMQQQSLLCKIEPLSPTPDMSPSYPQSEPSPDPLSNSPYLNGVGGNSTPGGANTTTNTNQTSNHPRPPSSSPPLTPTPRNTQVVSQRQNGVSPTSTLHALHASTMMGQLMGALNNSSLLDDLNLNIETLHGFDCNVDEVIKHELSMEGSLDFNFVGAGGATNHQHHLLNHQHPHHAYNQDILHQHHNLLGGGGLVGAGGAVGATTTGTSTFTSSPVTMNTSNLLLADGPSIQEGVIGGTGLQSGGVVSTNNSTGTAGTGAVYSTTNTMAPRSWVH